MPDAAAARPPRQFRVRPRGAWVVAGAMAVAAALALPGLTDHKFWDDEANTAIYARNLIEKGKLTAFDGKNLVGYAYGGALGEDLGQELRVPSLPAYVTAVGMMLFGQNTFGARVMFVLAGVLSVGLLAVWMRRYFGQRFPWWLPSVVLALSPAFLLYIRNCRYYALGVLLTLLVWTVWTPAAQPHSAKDRSLLDRRSLLRYAGGAIAIVLLIWCHYLNAATVLLTLPIFFLDRRFRQRQQYVLLAAIYAAAGLYGAWILATSSPFGASYDSYRDWMLPPGLTPDRWTIFTNHLWWLLRDLGSHEFFPWLLLAVLLLPWLVVEARRARPWAFRGWVLVAVLGAYVVVAAAATPTDMGKGPLAEMRYVVPLLAIGAAVGAAAMATLWTAIWPAAPVVFVLLVGSNVLHLGFLTDRFDQTSPWWPPTLYRYVRETWHGYESGNEQMLDMLKHLPEDTQVRTWPTYMTHPAIFYVPKLRYCDQLTERKKIRKDLLPELGDYLFVERAKPDVVFVPAPFLRFAWHALQSRFGRDQYELVNTLGAPWNYTFKPEIPARFFEQPPDGYPGMSVLVRKGSAAADVAALRPKLSDAAAWFRMGKALAQAGRLESAVDCFRKAARHSFEVSRQCLMLGDQWARRGFLDEATAHYVAVLTARPNQERRLLNEANLLTQRGMPSLAAPYYRAVVQCNEQNVPARLGLAVALGRMGRSEMACDEFQRVVEMDPKSVNAHFFFAEALARMGKVEQAVTQYQAALKLCDDPRLASEIRGILHDYEVQQPSDQTPDDKQDRPPPEDDSGETP